MFRYTSGNRGSPDSSAVFILASVGAFPQGGTGGLLPHRSMFVSCLLKLVKLVVLIAITGPFLLPGHKTAPCLCGKTALCPIRVDSRPVLPLSDLCNQRLICGSISPLR